MLYNEVTNVQEKLKRFFKVSGFINCIPNANKTKSKKRIKVYNMLAVLILTYRLEVGL